MKTQDAQYAYAESLLMERMEIISQRKDPKTTLLEMRDLNARLNELNKILGL